MSVLKTDQICLGGKVNVMWSKARFFLSFINIILFQTGATPLYTAVEEGHYEICQLLIEHGADVNKCPRGEWAQELSINQQSPLLLACIKNNTQIAELLLENNADVNLVNERGSSPLLVVCQFNNLSE